jgi:hypothetical protein
MQRVQLPLVRSQSSPWGVQTVSDWHSVRQRLFAQRLPVPQSAWVTHSKQRPTAVSQIGLPIGQSSELTHGV